MKPNSIQRRNKIRIDIKNITASTPHLLAIGESQRPIPGPVRMTAPKVERFVDSQQLINLLTRKVHQLRVRCIDQLSANSPPRKMRTQTLTSDAFRGHAFGKNACLVHVGPETDQDGVRRHALLLRDPPHDVVVSEGSAGGPKRGIRRNSDPLRFGEFHQLGLSARRVKFDLVDCRDDCRMFQEPLEVAHAPVGDPDSLDFVGVLLVDLLDLLVNI